MKDFSLQWLLTLRKNELKEIESELVEANNKIDNNEAEIREKENVIKNLKELNRGEFDSWKLIMYQKTIKDCKRMIHNLENKREFLIKEKNLISQKYKNKDKEIQSLEKQKKEYIKKEKLKQKKKEEAELNELSLIVNGGKIYDES